MPHGSGWGRTLVLIGILAVAGGALVLLPPMLAPQPVPSATAGPSVPRFTPLPSPPPAPSLAVSPYRSIEWTLAPFPDPAFEPGPIAVVGQRLVTVGVSYGWVSAWYSDDGVDWASASVPPRPSAADRQSYVRALAARPERILAVGLSVDETNAGGPFVLTSADKGVSWVQARQPGDDADLEIFSLATVGDRFVALAYDPASESGSSWWASSDGAVWQPLETSGLPDLRFGLSLAGNAEALVAGGSDGERAQQHPAAWFSADGSVWLPTISGIEQGGSIAIAAAQPAGYLLGGQLNGSPAVWISPDGRRWSSTPFVDLPGAQVGAAALSDAGALLVIERLTQGTETPSSTAVRFLRLGTSETADSSLPLVSLSPAALPDRFVVLGRCPPSGQPDCAGTSIGIGTPVP